MKPFVAEATMRRLMFLVLTLVSALSKPSRATAQSWQFDAFDNGAWFEAWVTAGAGLPSFVCGGASPTGLALPQSDEPIFTQVGALDLWMPDNAPMLQQTDPPPRGDLRLVVDTQAFALPNASYDLLNFYGWVQSIGVRDAAITTLAGSRAWAIDGRHGRWGPFASTGLGPALTSMVSYCEARWNGAPTAVAPQSNNVPAILDAAVQKAVADTCPMGGTLAPNAPVRTDLDGDGINDLILDMREVTCVGATYALHCGAAMCQISVFLSSVYPRRGQSDDFLGIGVSLVRGTDGQVWIGTGDRAAACPYLYDPVTCTAYWRFDGTRISAVPRP